VEFSEFITAACNRKRLLSKKNLEAAFTQMDTDQSGSLSSDELKRILGPLIDEQSWAEIVAKVDKDFDGEIDLSEFMKMMLSTS
jgi:Ca2+-binding EF-hand superfamily protein